MNSYDKGYNAYCEGMELDDNPFKEGTPDYEDWESGWVSASASDTTRDE